MIHRQKVLLHLMQSVDRSIGRTEMVKWAFLLSKSPSGGGRAFYGFLPYHWGPYSFSLVQELEALERHGYVNSGDDKGTWSLTDLGADFRISVDSPVRMDVWKLLSERKDRSTSELLDDVYEQFPWYSINSKRKRLATRPKARVAIYTAGYEGLSVDAFLNRLLKFGIEQIVDVRRNPVARRFGFHKNTLNRLAGNVGISYQHFPSLGIASKERQDLPTMEDRFALFDRYEASTLKEETEEVDRVAELMKERPSVLVCLEADHCACHRSRLASAVAQTSGLEIVNIGEHEESTG